MTRLALCLVPFVLVGMVFEVGEHWGNRGLVAVLGCVWFAVWIAVFFGDAFGPGVAVLRDRSRIRVSALSRAIHYRKGEVK